MVHVEGQSNRSNARADWFESFAERKSRPLLKRDTAAFPHQSPSCPCAAVAAMAEGIWMEDHDGRRYKDLHGSSAHHISYGRRRLFQAVKTQIDDQPFSPRRLASEPAIELVEKLGGIPSGIAAVVAESARATPYVPLSGFWRAVRDSCTALSALLTCDEIPAGFGKTGRLFACEHDGLVPDISVTGKALRGGIPPVAAAVAREIPDVCGDVAIGRYTQEKNPVSARSALTTLAIKEEGLADREAELGWNAVNRLRAFAETVPIAGDVRNCGPPFGIEIVEDACIGRPAVRLAERILHDCREFRLEF